VEVAEEIIMEKAKEEMSRILFENGVSLDNIAKSAGMPVEKIQSWVN
jgi:hypothetical protein